METLIAFLKTLDPSRFDMNVVAGQDGEELTHLNGHDLLRDPQYQGCIAGWACAIHRPDRRPSTWLALMILDLDELNGLDLFHNFEATLPQAIATLEHYQATGEVKW